MRAASYSFGDRPAEATDRFVTAARVLGESWVDLDLAQRLASLELSVEFLLRASDPSWSDDGDGEEGVRARAAAFAGVDTLLARDSLDPPSVLRGVWSSGLATRLLRERSLEGDLYEDASARAAAVGLPLEAGSLAAGFDPGAQAALRIAADKLASMAARGQPASREAWDAWDDALLLSTGTDPIERQRIALHAAEAVLESVSARPNDTASRDRLTSLLAMSDWSSTGDARSALVDWLDDPARFSTSALAVVTQWLATSAPESGVGVSETLSSGASGYQRSDLRGRLAARWTGGQPRMAASVLDRWGRSAEEVATQLDPSSSDPVDWLQAAADAARLSRAASLLWRGDNDAARTIIDDPIGVAGRQGGAPPRIDALSPKPDDGDFALRFLSANQNAQTRIDLLRDLVGRARELGPIDSEVVFEQSMFGTPSEVRRIAKRVVELRADDPTVINAGIEVLPRAPRTSAVGEMYEAVTGAILPAVDDPSWERATRAALVGRLLDILTGGAALDPADAIASTLASGYADRLGTPLDAGSSPDVLAGRLAASLLTEARAAGGLESEAMIASLTRRFEARRALAEGEMQRFAVEAVNAAEAMGALLTFERPQAGEGASEIVESLREEVADAPNTAVQMQRAELAALRLWMIRLGGTP